MDKTPKYINEITITNINNNTRKININLIKVEQNKNVFYVGKIKASDLIKIATVHVRGSATVDENRYINEVREVLSDNINFIKSSEGIQRVMQEKRLKEISKYLKDIDGILPSSIVVALNNKIDWDSEDRKRVYDEEGYILKQELCDNVYTLSITPSMVDAFIVDGQHRLGAFAYAEDKKEDYELVVSIFLEMETTLQAELFGVINSKQKPVNKSLLYDLSEFSIDEYNAEKKCHTVAKLFNESEKSPFYQQIRMLGTGYGSISQSAFIEELIKYVKPRRKSYMYKSIFASLQLEEITRILNSYFKSIKAVYSDKSKYNPNLTIWEDTENYVLIRTTGFGALMKSLYYIYIYFQVNDTEFKSSNLIRFLSKIRSVTDFSVEKEGKSAGQGLQSKLSKRILKELIGGEEQLSELENMYKIHTLIKV